MSLKESLQANAKPKVMLAESEAAKEFPDPIYIRMFNGDLGDSFLDEVQRRTGADGKPVPGANKRWNAFVFALGVCEENGEPVFDHTSDEDLAIVQAFDYPLLEQVADEIQTLNGLNAKARKAAKKNSQNGRTNSSGSDSPDTSEAEPSPN